MIRKTPRKYVVYHTVIKACFEFESVFDPEGSTEEFFNNLIVGVNRTGWFRTRAAERAQDLETARRGDVKGIWKQRSIDFSLLHIYQKPFVLVPPSDNWKIKDV